MMDALQWELDVSYVTLRLLALVGLVWDMVPVRRAAEPRELPFRPGHPK